MRHAFKLNIRPGSEEEYEWRHRAVYPQLLQVFRDAGVRSYSIFREGTTLFAYMEMDDLEKTMRMINQAEVNTKWQLFMADILLPIEPEKRMVPLTEVFHFENLT